MRIRSFLLLTFSLLSVSISFLHADMGIHSTVKIENPVFDFGTVASGATVEHEFRVRNSGKGDLVVNKIIPSCGCTAGKMDPEVIEPGDSGVIKVAFNTTGFSGRKVKTIRLYTNDPESDSVLLTLKGEIEPDTKVEPKQVFLTDVVKDGKEILNGQGSFTVSTRAGAGISIGKVRTYSPHLKIKETSTSKTSRTIEVTVLGSAPKGELRDKIIVSLKGGKRSSVNIPVYAVISGPVKASQSVVSFGVVKGEAPIRKSIKIENRGSAAVSVKEVQSTHEAITASIVEAKPGHNFVLHLDLNPQLLTSDLKGTVSVVTDSKDTGTIPVSVVGILPIKSNS